MDLFRNLFGTTKTRKPKARHHSAQLRLESLEGRVVPAVLSVDQGGAGFQTIQEAIDAANAGDVIRVYDGTYDETIDVNKDGLKILNKDGANTVIKPSTITSDEAIVDITAQDVFFKGFNIDGSALTDPAGASDFDSAIRVAGGGSATIRGNNISGLFDADGYTVANGFGVHIGDPGNGNGTAKVIHNDISDYFKSGVQVEAVDDGMSKAVIRSNTITGEGLTPVIDQNGIDVFGPNGTVKVRAKWNTITGNSFDTTGSLTASGVLLNNVGADDWVSISRNWIDANQSGIAVDLTDGSDVWILHNDITNSVQDGIVLLDSTNVNIIANDVTNSGFGGITLFDSSDNLIKWNRANNNGLEGIVIFGGSGNEILFDATSHNGTDGIALYGSVNNLIYANLSSGNAGNGIALYSDLGVDSSGNVIKCNFSIFNEGFGIYEEVAGLNTIEDNVVFGNGEDYGVGAEGFSTTADTVAAVSVEEADDLDEDYVDA